MKADGQWPALLPGFTFRIPEDPSDEKLLRDVGGHGWHVVAIARDEEGPGFAFTVGLYLRTLQPEVLIMGVDPAPAGRVLNAIGRYAIQGGKIESDKRYPGFADGKEVTFREIAKKNFREHLGFASWFYRDLSKGFPAVQCIWPDSEGKFPHERGFQKRLASLQRDLST